jgi:L,D-transpeptidase YcbB
MIRYLRASALALLLASPTMPGAIQTAALAQTSPRLSYQEPAQLPPQPASVWRRSAVSELVAYIEQVDREGLEPQAYSLDRLRTALDAGDEATWSQLANGAFLKLTADLSGGHVRGDSRVDWHMPDTSINGNEQQRLLALVSHDGGVAEVLNALLPSHSQYAGLREALAATPETDEAKRNLIRTNMERWRWMPRNLGERHVIVNVPAFTAAVVDNGQVIARHRTVVGTRRTPTPQLVSNAVAVTFNPWWHVPQSIIRELGSMRGYDVRRGPNGQLSVRQPPGPRNSLGRLKIEMPNDHAIYLHDTPAQALFSRSVRAFSHGCVRTQNIRDFAATLLAPTGQWDRSMIDAAIETGENQQVQLSAPVPVYIAYFTAAATTDGNIVAYEDIYGRDAPVRQALNRAATRGETAVASAAD